MLNLAEAPDGDANQVQESTWVLRVPTFECLQRGDIEGGVFPLPGVEGAGNRAEVLPKSGRRR